ncbi:endonuclease/exonuclease/phosphatase family protein, partial [bacterium M00.F.Ca.ET.229.01.1.1]
MKQQGARARTTMRALGLAVALALPGLVLAAGPQAATAAEAANAPGMSMVTFNRHHDREDWPSRRRTILAELKRLQPDAIALQEVI